jgi:26S proteasome regulatory subunit T5
MIDNEVRLFKSEVGRLTHQITTMNAEIADNADKIKLNSQLPHLVGNVGEILQLAEEEEEEDTMGGSGLTRDPVKAASHSMVVKTTTRQVGGFLYVFVFFRPFFSPFPV